MHEVLVNRLGGLSLPRKSVVRLTDRPDMTLDVYRGRKTPIQQQQQHIRTRAGDNESLCAMLPYMQLKKSQRWVGLEPETTRLVGQHLTH